MTQNTKDAMPSTPAAQWRARGEQDPMGDQYDCERAALTLGKLTDDELANAVYLHDHRSLDLGAIQRGEPSSIALLTAAKERIRWLSRALERALAPTAEQAEEVRVPRYIVIGYGESDYPQASFANDLDELLDAVLGMIYTKPSDACDDTREEYRRDLADEDEWCGKVWRTEFEIGGITVYDLGYGTAFPAADSQAAAPASSTGDPA